LRLYVNLYKKTKLKEMHFFLVIVDSNIKWRRN